MDNEDDGQCSCRCPLQEDVHCPWSMVENRLSSPAENLSVKVSARFSSLLVWDFVFRMGADI